MPKSYFYCFLKDRFMDTRYTPDSTRTAAAGLSQVNVSWPATFSFAVMDAMSQKARVPKNMRVAV